MKRKDCSEYGWITITEDEYERMREHEYAGPGTPLHPDAPGHWAMVNDDGETVLYTGVEITFDRPLTSREVVLATGGTLVRKVSGS